jgi:hypothetical protein
MPLLTELKTFLIFASTNMSRLRRWIANVIGRLFLQFPL